MRLILDKLVELFESKGPQELKGRWGIGQIVYIPNVSELPLARVRVVSADNSVTGTSEVTTTSTVEVAVITTWATDADPTKITGGYGQLLDLIGGVGDKYEIKNNSLLGVIFNNQRVIEGTNVFLGANENPIAVAEFGNIYDDSPANLGVMATIQFSVNFDNSVVPID